jgi:hypothetical protein
MLLLSLILKAWKEFGIELSRRFFVTDNPVSKPDQKYARRRDGQNYIWQNKEQIRTWRNRIPLCVQYIDAVCGFGLQGYR